MTREGDVVLVYVENNPAFFANLKKLAELGFMGLNIRDEYGGAEAGTIAFSVAITDAFMAAVKNDLEYDLIDPSTREVVNTLRAREVFDRIIDLAWHNGEPGVLFQLGAADRRAEGRQVLQREAVAVFRCRRPGVEHRPGRLRP